MYWFPIDTVTNDCTFSGLEHCKFIMLQFRRSEACSGSYWAEIQGPVEPSPPAEALGASLCWPRPAFEAAPSSAGGSSTAQSQRGRHPAVWLRPRLSCDPLSLTRTPAIALAPSGPSRVTSPSQGQLIGNLNFLCHVT